MASKLTKQINSRFNPTSLSGYSVYALGGYPKMYGFGSFLKNNWSAAISPAIGIGSLISGNSANEFSKQNAGTIGSVAGGALGTLVAPGIGTSIGAQIGGKLGSSIQNNSIESDTQMQEEAIKKQLISNLPAQHYYTPTFAMGGKMYPNGGEVDAISGAAPKKWQIPIKEREDFKGNWLNKLISNNIVPFKKGFDVGAVVDNNDLMRLSNKRIAGKLNNEQFTDSIRSYIKDRKTGEPLNKIRPFRPSNINASRDALYLHQGLPQQHNSFSISKYIPSNSSDSRTDYYAFTNEAKDEIINDLFKGKNKDFLESSEKERQVKNSTVGQAALRNFKYSKGRDDKGEYISYYDINDYGNFLDKIGKPFEIYDRIYVDRDSTGNYIPKENFADGGELSYLPSITNFTTPINTDLTIEKNPVYNDRSRFRKMGPSFRVEANKLDSYIDNIAGQLNNYNFPEKEKDGMRYKQTEFRKLKEDLYNYQQNPDTKKFEFADGGSIHIKPENRGKFTAAAKWHEMGGLLDSYAGGGEIMDRVTSFENGGLHSENGGIPIGQNALVERDEYMYTTKDGKKYIFSNNF